MYGGKIKLHLNSHMRMQLEESSGTYKEHLIMAYGIQSKEISIYRPTLMLIGWVVLMTEKTQAVVHSF